LNDIYFDYLIPPVKKCIFFKPRKVLKVSSLIYLMFVNI